MGVKRFSSDLLLQSHLLKLGNGLLISRNDPGFLRKYIRYVPNDPVRLHAYGKRLQASGRVREALQYYRRAAAEGYTPAQEELQSFYLTQKQNKLTQMKREQWADRLSLAALLLLILLCLGLTALLLNYLLQEHVFQKNVFHYYEKEVYTHHTVDTAADMPGQTTEANQLPVIVIQNALERYHQSAGNYPESLTSLAGELPDNRISMIPQGILYTPTDQGYILQTQNGQPIPSSDRLLELHFFPKSNQLALVYGEETLALYRVASGTEPMPFTKSSVTHRVVEPNGGSGVLGTRGLALQDGYAIHGTNTPESIGGRITKGCLRLRNEDIEILYPYVAAGTPFYVKEGEPSKPTFPQGLPSLEALAGSFPSSPTLEGTLYSADREKNSNDLYHWRD